ncbi:hypothetical protein [Pseudoruegeria sp. SK021]|uniref:hypothetical protein n=1 Tax=Pseudoruegeria sp. SK021 TaxID=1933035 RepID=UPI000A24006D|nr:hypothetical protein [Pseudoruegeria sp. SK021]OSP54781.1 hypothetical protein BV911_10690 [Pseudoruegeria sp. SK021]
MTEHPLRVMPREMRMMSERILSLTSLPKGFAMTVGDVVMYSEAMGFGGFAQLLAAFDTIKSADPTQLTLTQTDAGGLHLDGGGEHAWFVVPSLLDLLGEGLATAETTCIEVGNLRHPQELGIAIGLGRRAGLDLEIEGPRVTARRGPVADPVLSRVMAEGCPIAADLWWQVWALAQTALTPDSVVSRRHAGVNIVTEDGQVIGRTDNDDDTDTSFIAGSDVPDRSADTAQSLKTTKELSQ